MCVSPEGKSREERREERGLRERERDGEREGGMEREGGTERGREGGVAQSRPVLL